MSTASAAALPARPRPLRAVGLIARGVFLETIRRKEFYVLLLLAALYAVATLVVALVGIENAATATFLLNFGMAFAWIASHILVLLTAARQIPNELETRALYPLLAKPVLRTHYLLGKLAAASISGFLTLLVLLVLAWLPVPKLQSYDSALLLQYIVLGALSLNLLASLALLLSLFLPKGVNLVLLAVLFFGGDNMIGFVRAHASTGPLESLARWITFYIPDFSLLNLTTRYTDGMSALPPGELLGLLVYGIVFSAAALCLAALRFRRRAL